jgi:hypothetical protein
LRLHDPTDAATNTYGNNEKDTYNWTNFLEDATRIDPSGTFEAATDKTPSSAVATMSSRLGASSGMKPIDIMESNYTDYLSDVRRLRTALIEGRDKYYLAKSVVVVHEEELDSYGSFE